MTDNESALLGACIVQPDIIDLVGSIVNGADFVNTDLGKLFEALCIIRECGEPPISDIRLLFPELERMRVRESVCSKRYLAQLIDAGNVHRMHARYYAERIRDEARLRSYLQLACDLTERGSQHGTHPDDIAKWLDSRLATISHSSTEAVRTICDVAREVMTDLRRPDHVGGIMTGILSVDSSIGCICSGELAILAARPGCGKTSFAMQIARRLADKNERVLFVSLEMRDRELVTRELCGCARVDSRHVRTRRLDLADLAALEAETQVVRDIPLRLYSPATATMARIRAVARREHSAGKLALIVVDYIGLVKPSDRSRPRHEQVADISASCKALAKELDCPVLVCSQLNREADAAEPRLSHLRESGAIEQDADLVLFLHPVASDQTRLIVAKHRHGQTGAVPLRWIAAETRIADAI